MLFLMFRNHPSVLFLLLLSSHFFCLVFAPLLVIIPMCNLSQFRRYHAGFHISNEIPLIVERLFSPSRTIWIRSVQREHHDAMHHQPVLGLNQCFIIYATPPLDFIIHQQFVTPPYLMSAPRYSERNPTLLPWPPRTDTPGPCMFGFNPTLFTAGQIYRRDFSKRAPKHAVHASVHITRWL